MKHGVVVMAYGSPLTAADIGAYYTHIRRGRPPSAEQLDELRARYEAIGGVSPLAARTEAQRHRLAAALGDHGEFSVVLGQKHAPPFIEEAVAAVAQTGAERVVGLVLAPHYSRASMGDYVERLRAAAFDHGLEAVAIESWHDEPAWLDFQATAIRDGLAALPPETKVLFTAHSLPERLLVDDPYGAHLAHSAAAIGQRAGLDRWTAWGLAWQSAGRTPEPWRGPDIHAVLDDLAATGRARGVLVCPQGFTSDHLEVCFDLDIKARKHAGAVGLAFDRTRMVNDDPAVFAALAARVARVAGVAAVGQGR